MEVYNRPDVEIWTWDRAPFEYKELSGHGGDEGYVICIKSSLYQIDYKLELIIDALTVSSYETHNIDIGSEKYSVFITSNA